MLSSEQIVGRIGDCKGNTDKVLGINEKKLSCFHLRLCWTHTVRKLKKGSDKLCSEFHFLMALFKD